MATGVPSGVGSSGAEGGRQAASAEGVRETFSAGGPEASGSFRSESIAIAVVGPRDERLALVVERDVGRPAIGERDREQLSLYASFAAVSLARGRSV